MYREKSKKRMLCTYEAVARGGMYTVKREKENEEVK